MNFHYYFNGFSIETFSAANAKDAVRYVKKRYSEPVGCLVGDGMPADVYQKAKRESVNPDVLRVISE